MLAFRRRPFNCKTIKMKDHYIGRFQPNLVEVEWLTWRGLSYTLIIAYGVMVIVVGNGHGDTSSNLGRD